MQFQCNRYVHQEIDCPLIQFKPDLERILKKEAFNEEFNLSRYRSRRQSKHNSLAQNQMIEQSLKLYQEENQLNEDLTSHHELQNDKSVVSEQQFPSSQYIQSEKDIIPDQHGLRYNSSLLTIKLEKNKLESLRERTEKQFIHQLELSYLKVIPIVQESKQSQRRIVLSNDEILIPKQYNMIEEIETTLQKSLKSSLNIDSISLKISLYYMPQYQIEAQIKLWIKSQRKRSNKFWNIYEQLKKYTFSSFVKDAAIQMIPQGKRMYNTFNFDRL